MPADARWFAEYLETFAACARGDRETAALLRYYGVPLIVTSDAGAVTLTSENEVAAVVQGELDGLRGMGYDHTEVLSSEVTVLNTTSALYRGSLSRRDRNGTELGCPTVTYLVTDGGDGPRISVLAAHGT
jgi:hypothetical protein